MNSILYIDDTGKAELYDDDYNITIFCKDEQEQQRAMKRLEVANRMRWHPVTKCDEHPKNNKPYIVSIKWASDSGKINAENAFAKYDAYEAAGFWTMATERFSTPIAIPIIRR